jgi:ACS family hexuronate transporter-like MFS transporter
MRSTQSSLLPALVSSGPPRLGRWQWVICALLFLATTINYVDRHGLGILKPELTGVLGWEEVDCSNIVFPLQLTGAACYPIGGREIDARGARAGYALAVTLWRFAAMGHAWVRSVAGSCGMRLALCRTEGGNLPAAVKTVTEWSPKNKRALVTPLLVPWLTLHYGWAATFKK